METPERHKESGDGEYASKRVLCATETVVTDNEDDNEEPLNVPSETSRGVSPRRPAGPIVGILQNHILEEGKDFPSLAFTHKRGGYARLHFYMNTFGNYRFVSAMR